MVLDKDAIKRIQDRPIKTITVPQWGGDVNIRVLSGREREIMEKEWENVKNSSASQRAWFAVLVTCDDDGNPLFDKSDIEWLSDKSGEALDVIFNEGMELNGIGKDAVEDAEKN